MAATRTALEWLASVAPDPGGCRRQWARDPHAVALLPAGTARSARPRPPVGHGGTRARPIRAGQAGAPRGSPVGRPSAVVRGGLAGVVGGPGTVAWPVSRDRYGRGEARRRAGGRLRRAAAAAR